MLIYHNPRCRKSRETLQLIEDHGTDPEIRLYLDDKPNKKELREVLKKLGITAEALVRKQEAVYKEKYKGRLKTEDDFIRAMLEEPRLIERPIVIKGDRAILGRPPENVLKLF